MLLAWLCVASIGPEATIDPGFQSDAPRPRYEIEVAVDPETRELRGEVHLWWPNPAQRELRSIPVHLYLNAFSGTASTWMWGMDVEALLEKHDDPWGYIELERVVQVVDIEKPVQTTFIQPNSPNPLDRSLAELTLASTLSMGETLELKMPFRGRLPVPIARTGGAQGWLHVAQWFPKPGVYDVTRDRWAARQFHRPTEFFADFADWDVTIRVPSDYTVVATGVGSEVKPGQWRFVQARVHDFAFVVAREVHTETHQVQAPGRSEPVELTLVTPAGTEHQLPRVLAVAERTFAVMGQRVGPYPFSTMKVVNVPARAIQTSGMEYPTLVTAGLADPIYDWLWRSRLHEIVTAHEIIHNYFQGVVANDEQRHGWLDEGLTTFWEHEVMRDLAGDRPGFANMLGYPFGWATDGLARVGNSRTVRETALREPTYLFDPGTVGFQIYRRPAMTFITARRRFGQKAVDRLFSSFYAEFMFRHPNPSEFFSIAERVGPQDMASFLKEAFEARSLPDYKVEKAKSERWKGFEGRVPDGDGGILSEPSVEDGVPAYSQEADGQVGLLVTDPGYIGFAGTTQLMLVEPKRVAPDPDFERDDAALWRTQVQLGGPGWRALPVDVELIFADGVMIRDRWDGRARWRGYELLRKAPLVSATIDPNHELVLDRNRWNNGRRIEPVDTSAKGMGHWIARIGQWLLIGLLGWL